MKKAVLFFCLLVLSTADLLSQQNEFPKLTGPYLGQKPPGITPEIFAPGIVSLEDEKELGGGTFSPDGKEYYFTRVVNGRWRIIASRLEETEWSFPEPVNFTGEEMALEPHITLDNSKIFWISRREVNTGTYMSLRTKEGWSEARYVGHGEMVSSNKDGELFVTDHTQIPNQIVSVKMEDGHFVQYTKLKAEIEEFQKENRTAHPCVSPDGSYLVFDINSTHLFVSFRNTDRTWKKPIDLTLHGISPDAGIASISPDGKYMFFKIGGDVYWVDVKIIEKLRSNQWEKSK